MQKQLLKLIDFLIKYFKEIYHCNFPLTKINIEVVKSYNKTKYAKVSKGILNFTTSQMMIIYVINKFEMSDLIYLIGKAFSVLNSHCKGCQIKFRFSQTITACQKPL